jgi:hypothetical protein
MRYTRATITSLYCNTKEHVTNPFNPELTAKIPSWTNQGENEKAKFRQNRNVHQSLHQQTISLQPSGMSGRKETNQPV